MRRHPVSSAEESMRDGGAAQERAGDGETRRSPTARPAGPGSSWPPAGGEAAGGTGGLGAGRTAAVTGGPAVATRQLVLAGLLAAVTAVLAYLRIPLPFTPVPITGQTLGVMLSGLLLGPRWGFAAQLAYVLLGAAGAPVFAGGQAGPGVLAGPTGGYLLSYPLAAALIGWLAGTGRGRPAAAVPGFWRALVAAVMGGVVLVYAMGAPWLALVTGRAWREVWLGAALPFIPGDLLKAVVAAWLAPAVLRAAGRR